MNPQGLGNGERGSVDRRQFLQIAGVAGAGLVVGIHFDEAQAATAPADFAPSAYLQITPDGTIRLFADHVELGQGVMTSLPMIIAEELDADWSKVKVERLQDNPSAWPRGIFTVGSGSVLGSWTPLRRAGADARMRLVAAAASRWNVPAAECSTENSVVKHAASKRQATYGELATDAATQPANANPTFKDPSTYRIVGTRRARVDIPSKVNGSAQFGMDVRLPDMLVATVLRPPTFVSPIVSVDSAAALATPGVVDVVQLPRGVAVVAKDTWSAIKGRRALKVVWNDATSAGYSSDSIRKAFAGVFAQNSSQSVTNKGDAAGVIGAATAPISAEYELPYAAHAPMEPLNCTVHVRADGADIWAPTQAPSQTQQIAASTLKVPVSAIKVHVMMAGGGFGRRANADVVTEALMLGAALMQRGKSVPVKLMWTREDDMTGGYYRPFSLHRLAGVLDNDGWPSAWSHRVVSQHALGPGDSVAGASNLPYAIPNVYVDVGTGAATVPVFAWRAVGHSGNGFVKESFIDELAAAGKKDPLEYRRHLLAASARSLGVLDLAAEKANWGKALPAGSGRGIAVHNNVGSYCAQVAEVTVRNNEIRVDRIVCAVDCGTVVNPDTVAAQLEGAIIFALTCAMKNEITIADGRVEQDNFNTYPMLRMSETPKVEVHLVKSTAAPSGVGELGVPTTAPAVGNAIFAATGKRLRKLPFRLV